MRLDDLLQRCPPRFPRGYEAGEVPAGDDSYRLLGPEDGVRSLREPPAQADVRRVPEKSGDDGCHLFVIRETGIPYILETAPAAASLSAGKVKHTNLTGGARAAGGGELWVDPVDDRRLYVNGCSGRYGPRSREELESMVAVLRGLGYAVRSFGWNDEVNKPWMVLDAGE